MYYRVTLSGGINIGDTVWIEIDLMTYEKLLECYELLNAGRDEVERFLLSNCLDMIINTYLDDVENIDINIKLNKELLRKLNKILNEAKNFHDFDNIHDLINSMLLDEIEGYRDLAMIKKI